MIKGNMYIWLIFALVLCSCSQGIDEYVRQSRHVDVDVRVYGVEKLGESGQLDAVPHLIQALKDEKARVRLAAVDALGQIGDSTAVDALVAVVREEVPVLRLAAIDALGQIGDSTLFLSCYENIRLLFHNKFVFFEEVSFYVQVMRCLGSEFDTAPF